MNREVELKDEIIDFFDDMALDRDGSIESDPIVDYEQRMRQLQIRELMAVKGGDLFLDAGCGNLRDAKVVLGNGDVRYVGIDFSLNMLREGRRKFLTEPLYLTQGDITSLPFRSKSFDLVLCSEVLEHIPNWEQALLELSRVLKDTGSLIISTPNNFSVYFPQKVYLEKRYGSKHPYDRWKNYLVLRRKLKEIGLSIVGVRGACYLPGLIVYKGRPKKLVSKLLPLLEWLERVLLSKAFTKYFGYVIVVKANAR